MNASESVLMAFPPESGGGDPAGLLASMGLSGVEVSPNIWKVGVSGPPPAVESRTLATPWNADRKFDLLKMYPTDLPAEFSDRYRQTRERLIARGNEGNLTAILNLIQVDATSVDNSEIAALADHYDRDLGKYQNDGKPLFPNHTTHVVTFDELIYKRSKLPQILIRIDQDPQFPADLANHKFDELPLGEIFNSNDVLLHSLRVFDVYIAPLIGARSPGIWGVNGARLFGSIIFSLGTVVVGLEPTPAELLQLLPQTLGAWSTVPPGELARRSCIQAIDWWSLRLGQMFEYLANPTLFGGHDRHYLPYMHQNWLMTVDQMFRRIGSINLNQRDINAQLVLMFSAMDVIGDRITDDGAALYRPSRAEQALAVVQEGMLPKAADLLMPKAARAVEALGSVQKGFFIKGQRGTTAVKLVNDKGVVESWDMDTATQKLLRARRNAVHGFGGLKHIADDATRILAQHDGNLPPDVVDLPYLYLLEFLCTPERSVERIRDLASEWNKPEASH